MPKYCYQCDNCSQQYYVWHGMTEGLEACIECASPSVFRIPSMVSEIINDEVKEKVGTVVIESIEEARKEIEDFKRNATKEINK